MESFIKILKFTISEIIKFSLTILLTSFFFWRFGAPAGGLWLIFWVFLFYRLDSRVVVILSLVLMASCPIMLGFKEKELAEIIAAYAYLLLVIAMSLQVVDYIRLPK